MKSKYAVFLMAAAIIFMISLPVQASDSDELIVSGAEQSHVFKTYLKNDDVKVESKEGVVTLTGTVSDESHKSLAEETIANMPGVKSVDNQLEFKGEENAENSDAWLGMKVKTSLLYHRSVSGFATDVDVKDGVVTLRGDAVSQEQKDLATEYARDIEGVKDVNNEMTVGSTSNTSNTSTIATTSEKQPLEQKATSETTTLGEKIDDASITAVVKSSLLYQRSTSGLDTKVETKDGVVTLSGKARNEAEKQRATKYAQDVNGVKSVNNQMTFK